VFAAILLPVVSAVAQQRNSDIENIGNRDINKGDSQIRVPNLEAEVELGRNLARELEGGVTLLNDPVAVDYVNRVGQIIVRNSDAKLPFTIKVIDSTEVNVVALPGGFLYVHTGLIQAADNEAQLAAMMSHAVAHVAARHAAEQQGKATFINILSIPSTAFPGRESSTPQKGSALPAMFYSFNRQAEEEADWLGLQYLYKAGYDPTAMVAFFRKMATTNGGQRVSSLFSTHPQTEDRIEKSNENIKTYLPARQQNVVTTAEFQEIKNRLLEPKPK
jgi:predicted Zn-dependent protease